MQQTDTRTGDKYDNAKRLHEGGMGFNALARKMGVHKSTLYAALKRRGTRFRNSRSVRERFLDKIGKPDANGCWPWTASKNNHGYGEFSVRGKIKRASRVSYGLFVGKIPHGLCVCHKCDNPECVNPEHLFVGTRSDNTQDAIQKGRLILQQPPHTGQMVGVRNGNAKLTPEKVRMIRQLSKEGLSHPEVARRIGNVSHQTVGAVARGERWKHVK